MEKIRSEYVVRIEGNIRARKDPNKKIPTGMVELEADAVTILNAVNSKLPFLPAEDSVQLSEEVRLKHRVLDLRYGISQHLNSQRQLPHPLLIPQSEHSTPLTELPCNLQKCAGACLMKQYHAFILKAAKLMQPDAQMCACHCRRQQMATNLRLRHKVIKTIRNFLDAKDFLEVETPILGRATPEGARDFLVPSR